MGRDESRTSPLEVAWIRACTYEFRWEVLRVSTSSRDRRNLNSLFYFLPLRFKTLIHYGRSNGAFLNMNNVLSMPCMILSINEDTSMSITVLLPF